MTNLLVRSTCPGATAVTVTCGAEHLEAGV